jgi:hypothetical protein
MTAHILDQPILAALTTRHGVHAQGGPLAFRRSHHSRPLPMTARRHLPHWPHSLFRAT